jgi:uncharacterized protein YllA (UPF0747 family)
MSITLLEPRTLRFLKKHAIDLQDVLLLEKPKLVKKVLKEQTGFDYKDLTQKSRQLTKDYLTAVQQLGVNISKMERCLYEAIKEDLGEQRAREKARLEKTLKDAETLSDLLKPFGKRQERVFNIFYYMNLYGGLTLIDWLYERYDPSLETLELSS